jgi:hypothetical protein
MTLERSIRLLAGIMLSISLVLYYLVSPYWLLLAVFVAFNLIQSSFTGFCPPEIVFKKLFFKEPARQTVPVEKN